MRNFVVEWTTMSAPSSMRPLQVRRAERVVDHHQRAVLVRDFGARGDVGDRHHRIGRRLEEDDLRIRPQRRADFFDARGVDVRELQAELLADLVEEAERAAVHVLAGDDVIARLQHAEDGVRRRHPRGEAVRVFAAFERGEVRLEHGARRVLRPRVLEAFVLAELRLHVGRGLENRIGDGAGDRLRLLAGVDAIGGEAHVCSFRVVGCRVSERQSRCRDVGSTPTPDSRLPTPQSPASPTSCKCPSTCSARRRRG